MDIEIKKKKQIKIKIIVQNKCYVTYEHLQLFNEIQESYKKINYFIDVHTDLCHCDKYEMYKNP